MQNFSCRSRSINVTHVCPTPTHPDLFNNMQLSAQMPKMGVILEEGIRVRSKTKTNFRLGLAWSVLVWNVVWWFLSILRLFVFSFCRRCQLEIRRHNPAGIRYFVWKNAKRKHFSHSGHCPPFMCSWMKHQVLWARVFLYNPIRQSVLPLLTRPSEKFIPTCQGIKRSKLYPHRSQSQCKLP